MSPNVLASACYVYKISSLIHQHQEMSSVSITPQSQLMTQVHPASCTCLQLLSRMLERKFVSLIERRSCDRRSWHNKLAPSIAPAASRTTPKFRRCSHPRGCQDKLDRFLMSTMTRAKATRKFNSATRCGS